MDDQLWQFNYKKGPAPMTSIVRASSEERAYLVAQRWCEKQGYRAPAAVRPMIVADESTLLETAPPAVRSGVTDPIGATTRVMSEKAY